MIYLLATVLTVIAILIAWRRDGMRKMALVDGALLVLLFWPWCVGLVVALRDVAQYLLSVS
jgi:hypothetical protein